MADKEERIIIAVAEPSLLEGGADKIYPCMTRQEAIEIMAKALCRMATNGECRYSCDTCDFTAQEKVIAEIFPQLEYSFTEQAEAALNALLER